MCEEYSMVGKGPIMQTVMTQTWELLTEEQKKKVAVMRMDMITQLMELKISDMEKMITLKKTAIANIQKVKEMMKQSTQDH
jgi:hypothetical protein